MPTVTYETRRKPPFWIRVIGTGLINLIGLIIANGFNLVTDHNKFSTLVLAAIVLAVVNILVKPVFFVLSLPFIVATLGFFILIVNSLMLWITDILVPKFDLFGFWHTIGAALILSLANVALSGVMKDLTEKPQQQTYNVV